MTSSSRSTLLSKYFVPISGERVCLRLVALIVGTSIFGLAHAFLIQSGWGVPPWTVFSEGLALSFGGTIGGWTVITSFLVMTLWFPLKERFGLGTVVNSINVGLTMDLSSTLIPAATSPLVAGIFVALGILLAGIGSGLYIGAKFGPGPRDGLMTGLSSRYSFTIRATRFAIELSVLFAGLVLGGTFGIGTVAFALFIGPLVQYFLDKLSFKDSE